MPSSAAQAETVALEYKLEALRAMVLADAGVEATLGSIQDQTVFVAQAACAARAWGLDLTPDEIGERLSPRRVQFDPFHDPCRIRPPAPQAGWLPVKVAHDGADYRVDWAWFGDRRLTDPFFEGEARRVMALPFNRLFQFQTSLADLRQWAAALPALKPDGLIFHMSRCGSTLAAQMLASSPRDTVISEAAPIDAAIQIARDHPEIDGAALLRDMVHVFGQVRERSARRYFIKLDCWHTLALPLVRQAFPDTPWVFLYREPVEVMVSQMRQRGSQMVPQFVPPSLYGIELADGVPGEDYCAQVLAAVCEGALREHAEHPGLMVNYAELPQALLTRILPHFRITPTQDERQAMTAAARFNAKAVNTDFKPDANEKRLAASDAVRAATARRLEGPYARLEAVRAAQISQPGD